MWPPGGTARIAPPGTTLQVDAPTTQRILLVRFSVQV